MKFLRSGWFKFIILVVIIIGIATAFYFKEDENILYRTATVSKGNIESSVEGSGTITSVEARKIYSKVSSEVLSVLHKEGEHVNSGDVIAILDHDITYIFNSFGAM